MVDDNPGVEFYSASYVNDPPGHRPERQLRLGELRPWRWT